MRLSRLVSTTVVAVVVAACSQNAASPSRSTVVVGGSGQPSVFPVVVNSEFGVGPNRFLFVLTDSASNNPASSPERTAEVAFTPPGSSPSAGPAKATFLWGIEDVRGYYLVDTTFPTPGSWSASITTAAPGKPSETITVPFQVKEKTSAVGVGQKAPSVKTPTLADVGGDVSKISSDQHPDLDFYRVSEDQALAQRKPFVLVFATPKFCQSALCGPQLDKVKAIAKDYPTVTFINIEPYKLEQVDGQLQPVVSNGALVPVESVNAFGLLSEPWLYVVDRTGTVVASLEGVFSDQELRTALDKVT